MRDGLRRLCFSQVSAHPAMAAGFCRIKAFEEPL